MVVGYPAGDGLSKIDLAGIDAGIPVEIEAERPGKEGIDVEALPPCAEI